MKSYSIIIIINLILPFPADAGGKPAAFYAVNWPFPADGVTNSDLRGVQYQREVKSLFAASIGWKWSINNMVYTFKSVKVTPGVLLEVHTLKVWTSHNTLGINRPTFVKFQRLQSSSSNSGTAHQWSGSAAVNTWASTCHAAGATRRHMKKYVRLWYLSKSPIRDKMSSNNIFLMSLVLYLSFRFCRPELLLFICYCVTNYPDEYHEVCTEGKLERLGRFTTISSTWGQCVISFWRVLVHFVIASRE